MGTKAKGAWFVIWNDWGINGGLEALRAWFVTWNDWGINMDLKHWKLDLLLAWVGKWLTDSEHRGLQSSLQEWWCLEVEVLLAHHLIVNRFEKNRSSDFSFTPSYIIARAWAPFKFLISSRCASFLCFSFNACCLASLSASNCASHCFTSISSLWSSVTSLSCSSRTAKMSCDAAASDSFLLRDWLLEQTEPYLWDDDFEELESKIDPTLGQGFCSLSVLCPSSYSFTLLIMNADKDKHMSTLRRWSGSATWDRLSSS